MVLCYKCGRIVLTKTKYSTTTEEGKEAPICEICFNNKVTNGK